MCIGTSQRSQGELSSDNPTVWQICPLGGRETLIISNGFAIDDKAEKNLHEKTGTHMWEASWMNRNQLFRLTPL